MKKYIKSLLSLIPLAIMGIGTTCVVKNFRGLNYDINSTQNVGNSIKIVSEDTDSITIKKINEGKFKVLMFTDLHLNGKKKTDNLAIKNLLKNIIEEKPDLVIFGGDTITSGFSKKLTRDFADIMEKTGVYWTTVLGNHEGEGPCTFSRKEFIELFASYEHCLIKSGLEDIDGNGNCTINILNTDNALKEVFFLMDSGDYMTKELKEKYGVEKKGQVYDGIKESQVEWYKEKHNSIKNIYGDFKSIAVMHIPPYECANAENYEFLYGKKREGICQAGFNSGILNAFAKTGNTQAVYFGHDHINDFGYMYGNILLSYIQASGYGSYNMKTCFNSPESEWLQGCTVLIFNDDGTYEAKRKFNHKGQ